MSWITNYLFNPHWEVKDLSFLPSSSVFSLERQFFDLALKSLIIMFTNGFRLQCYLVTVKILLRMCETRLIIDLVNDNSR